MASRNPKKTLALAFAVTACVCGVAVASAQAASPTPPIGAYTTKGTWKFLSRPDLHPPKVAALKTGNLTKLAAGYFMVANFRNLTVPAPMVGQSGPLILDNRLQPVWFGPVPANVLALNLKAQTYNGKPALSWWQGVISPLGATVSGTDMVYDQRYKRVAKLSGQDGWVISPHEMLISGHDAWVTAYKNEQADLSSVGGSTAGLIADSAIQEYDLKTGKLLATWDARDHIPLTDSYAGLPASPTIPWDAYHVNSINPVGGGKYIVSMRNTWAAYLVDTKTGDIDWTLGGKHSSFKLGAGASFEWQHDVELHKGNVVSVFDDACCAIGATVGPPSGPTRGLVLKLNMSTKTATRAAQYTRGTKFNAAFLGNTDLLPNGNVAIGWGSQPFFSEVTSTGNVLLDAAFPNPDVNYRTYVQRWTGTPWRAPNGTVRKGKHGALVFASWNGATQLGAWRVMAGRDAKHLAVVVASKDKRGFETAIPLTASYKKYKVQALDSKGHVLRSSGVFPTSKPPSTLPPGY
jgi:Arylsulfotransferase (ASST)